MSKSMNKDVKLSMDKEVKNKQIPPFSEVIKSVGILTENLQLSDVKKIYMYKEVYKSYGVNDKFLSNCLCDKNDDIKPITELYWNELDKNSEDIVLTVDEESKYNTFKSLSFDFQTSVILLIGMETRNFNVDISLLNKYLKKLISLMLLVQSESCKEKKAELLKKYFNELNKCKSDKDYLNKKCI